jgi:hypothetical protein
LEVVTLAASVNRSHLLRLGASARLQELRAEIAAIEKAFPDLASAARARVRRGSRKKAASREQRGLSGARRPKRPRRRWTAAQRKAAADRMRAYWSKRKSGARK